LGKVAIYSEYEGAIQAVYVFQMQFRPKIVAGRGGCFGIFYGYAFGDE
jgi:N-acetyl-anhydromuramyl-L-alanine amidase AmpD